MKNMTIGKCIGTGFTIILALLGIMGLSSYLGLNGVVSNAGDVIEGNALQSQLAQREVDHLNWAGQLSQLITDESVTELTVETDPRQCAFGQWYYSEERRALERKHPSLAPLLAAIEEPHDHLHASAVKLGDSFAQPHMGLSTSLEAAIKGHYKWVSDMMQQVFLEAATMNPEALKTFTLSVQKDATACDLGKWLKDERTLELASQFSLLAEACQNIDAPHNRLHDSAEKIEAVVRENNFAAVTPIYDREIKPSLAAIEAEFKAVIDVEKQLQDGFLQANRVFAEETLPALASVQEHLHRIRREGKELIMTDEAMLTAAQATEQSIVILGSIALVAGLALAIFIAQRTKRRLLRSADELQNASQQVAAAAQQVAGSSEALSSGTSEQAASIEETTSSLEEVSGMTQSNADNATEANQITQQSQQLMSTAQRSMGDLTTSMQDISRSGTETQKIIKTIDEIAFQTNILALNAAVEAARAGEAGAGFAVVADEVRSLAQRAADAARNTAELLEESATKITRGSQLVEKTNEVFLQVAESSAKISDLVAGIAQASQEQSTGITQINSAVTDIDNVTQQTAANCEETAAAAEELNSQAEQLYAQVTALRAMVTTARAKQTLLTTAQSDERFLTSKN